MPSKLGILVLILAGALWACGGGDTDSLADAGPDGTPDAAWPDGGTDPDAGHEDDAGTGTDDAGTDPDAGVERSPLDELTVGGQIHGSVEAGETQTLELAANPGQGYYTLELEADGQGATFVANCAGHEVFSRGITRLVTLWWALEPGVACTLSLERAGTGADPVLYEASLDYTPVDDPYEPNDTEDDAAELQPDQIAQAMSFAGHGPGGAPTTTDFVDWYEVSVDAGDYLVVLDDISGLSLGVWTVVDADSGEELDLEPPSIGPNTVSYLFVAPGGRYRFEVVRAPMATVTASGEGTALPRWVTQPYEFAVKAL